VPYRSGPQFDKIAPFRSDEGMSFGRQTHMGALSGNDDPELFPESPTEPDFSKAN
jgi:hypothetical protein